MTGKGSNKDEYDLVVIGTGSAGSGAASRCRRAGWTVAIIDSRPFGGTCALRGCDPKKVLVGAAEALYWGHRLAGRGVSTGEARVDWRQLMDFKRTFTEPVPKNREEGFARAGIDTFHGGAAFVGPTSVRIGENVLEARHVVIASGAMPAKLGIPGEGHLITSEDFLELTELPKRIVFVGAGYISMEFANVAVRAGAQVTVLHRGSRPLQGFDHDLAVKVAQAAHASGIDLSLETHVEAIEQIDGGFRVRASGPAGTHAFEADLVVHGAGRVAAIDDLDLATACVERGKRGVLVNEYLQSISNPAVYAAGDAAETVGLPLTPVAAIEGKVVATNLLNGNKARPNYSGTPTVAFTLPPIAAVGLREDEARQQGLKFKVNYQDTSSWYSSRRLGEQYSASKVLIEEGTGRILGAHLLGPSADELINVFALAIRRGLTSEDLRDAIFAYPTHASDLAYMV
ncbi:MAG: dihydrolipoyl dehydrogenase family protein [Candidatus Methylomirabilales bacterium]